MAQTEAIVAIENIAQPDLSQIVAALLVVPALRELVARVGAGHVGIEVGGVVG